MTMHGEPASGVAQLAAVGNCPGPAQAVPAARPRKVVAIAATASERERNFMKPPKLGEPARTARATEISHGPPTIPFRSGAMRPRTRSTEASRSEASVPAHHRIPDAERIAQVVGLGSEPA